VSDRHSGPGRFRSVSQVGQGPHSAGRRGLTRIFFFCCVRHATNKQRHHFCGSPLRTAFFFQRRLNYDAVISGAFSFPGWAWLPRTLIGNGERTTRMRHMCACVWVCACVFVSRAVLSPHITGKTATQTHDQLCVNRTQSAEGPPGYLTHSPGVIRY
jgi:hypothetical protein